MFAMKSLFLILAGLAIAAIAAAGSPASARSSTPPIAVVDNCRDAAVLVPGVEERVRQRVPAQFALVRDPLGRPLLWVFASSCRYTIDGRTRQRPTTSGYFAAIIESPDGSGCMSRWPVVGDVKPDLVPLCNLYFLSGAWDNRAVVRAYRSLFPGIALRYVRDLAYQAGEFDLTRIGAPLRFRAGPPTPSPFELDAVLRGQPVTRPSTFSFWREASSGAEGLRVESYDFTDGQMDATLRAAPGSEMADLLGTETPTPITGFVARYSAEVRSIPPQP